MFPTGFNHSSCEPGDASENSSNRRKAHNFPSAQLFVDEDDLFSFQDLEGEIQGTKPAELGREHQPSQDKEPTSACIHLDDQHAILMFCHPPTTEERKFMSLLKLLGSHIGDTAGLTAPIASSMSWQHKITSLIPLVDFFRTSMQVTFVRASDGRFRQEISHGSPEDNKVVTDKAIIAEAMLRWMTPQKRLSLPCIREIERLVLRANPGNEGGANQDRKPEPRRASCPSAASPPWAAQKRPHAWSLCRSPMGASESPKRRRLGEHEEEAPPAMPSMDMAGHYPDHKDLMEELERTQHEVGHQPDNDVHRGKGQGIKNINARLYTPLVASRALDYASVTAPTSRQTDEAKRAIALEILIQLARVGGRIRDADNCTPLNNARAVKKVMAALKDKAREMKKRGTVATAAATSGSRSATTSPVHDGDVICLARRTRENVELLKMLRDGM